MNNDALLHTLIENETLNTKMVGNNDIEKYKFTTKLENLNHLD